MRLQLLTYRWLQTLLVKTTSRRSCVILMTFLSILCGQIEFAGPPGPTTMRVPAVSATPDLTLLRLGH